MCADHSCSAAADTANLQDTSCEYCLAHTHTRTHARTHTHAHTQFLWFTGTLHRRNGFYTVQTECAIAYTYPTTKLSPNRQQETVHFHFPPPPQKKTLCMIYKHFELWGH